MANSLLERNRQPAISSDIDTPQDKQRQINHKHTYHGWCQIIEQLHRFTGIGSYEIQKHIYCYHSRSEKIKQYQLDMYEKIHVTPDEQKCWGLSGGSHIQTFDTDCGKIGIVICYDVEFPELSRLMAEDGMQILFVPFMTDTQNAYSRVRVCAQARAIENECYVAIAGSVGNLPRVHNMDIQYAQSAVFTPCDFAFPNDGKRSEATPNTEMILVSDVDLNLLNELHTYGAVRNLRDRRKDLYELKQKK